MSEVDEQKKDIKRKQRDVKVAERELQEKRTQNAGVEAQLREKQDLANQQNEKENELERVLQVKPSSCVVYTVLPHGAHAALSKDTTVGCAYFGGQGQW